MDGLTDKIRTHTSGNLEIIASDAVEKLDVVLAKKAVVKEYFNILHRCPAFAGPEPYTRKMFQ